MTLKYCKCKFNVMLVTIIIIIINNNNIITTTTTTTTVRFWSKIWPRYLFTGSVSFTWPAHCILKQNLLIWLNRIYVASLFLFWMEIWCFSITSSESRDRQILRGLLDLWGHMRVSLLHYFNKHLNPLDSRVLQEQQSLIVLLTYFRPWEGPCSKQCRLWLFKVRERWAKTGCCLFCYTKWTGLLSAWVRGWWWM